MEKITLRLSGTNCFLIKNNARYVLIDTGYEEDWDLFRQQLSRSGVSLGQVSHIILTHHHDDHCGLLNKIIAENKDIRVVMSRRAPELLLQGENDRTRGGWIINPWIGRLWVFKQLYLSIRLKQWIPKNHNLKFPPYQTREQDVLICGDTRLKEIGIDLEGVLIETPGHSLDSISLLFADGDCFVGDAAANFLQFAGTHYCVIFVTDLDEYYRSWEKVLSLYARAIFPAHGGPFPAEKLSQNQGKNRKEDLVAI
ncbi:MAG TPA: MBL fold metallo-hydrolase [Anaerolineaceae bacterium]|nr:MBL fold metallo-hydrolase [Anaerolineaceae bacterium]